jgi:hypothetical protein
MPPFMALTALVPNCGRYILTHLHLKEQTKMTPKRKYFTAAMQQDVKWLVAATANPSPYMRPIHIALGKLAIRKKGGAA